MAKELTTGRGLRRFRAALAEVEKELNICPECDTVLVPAVDLGIAGPGQVASMLPYAYCERCKLYYMHGKVVYPSL